jgi:hypothetical protein
VRWHALLQPNRYSYEPVAPVAPVVAALLRLCCSSVKALLQLCYGSVAALLRLCCSSVKALLHLLRLLQTRLFQAREIPLGSELVVRSRSAPVSICTFVPVKQVNGVVPGGVRARQYLYFCTSKASKLSSTYLVVRACGAVPQLVYLSDSVADVALASLIRLAAQSVR